MDDEKTVAEIEDEVMRLEESIRAECLKLTAFFMQNLKRFRYLSHNKYTVDYEIGYNGKRVSIWIASDVRYASFYNVYGLDSTDNTLLTNTQREMLWARAQQDISEHMYDDAQYDTNYDAPVYEAE